MLDIVLRYKGRKIRSEENSYYRNAVGNFSDTMNKAQECISNKISTRDSYVNSTDYSNFGIYTQNSISQDIELPIETERYKIEDATYVNGVPD